jgi:hypothetical protein
LSGPRQKHIVSRNYKPAPDKCARALQILLDQPLTKMAGEPAPEPTGSDGTRIQEDSANVILPD